MWFSLFFFSFLSAQLNQGESMRKSEILTVPVDRQKDSGGGKRFHPKEKRK